MEYIDIIIKNNWSGKILNTCIILIISLIIYKICTFILSKSTERDRFNLFTSKKSKTYIKLIKSLLRYIFIALTFLIILQTNGIDVSSVLAGVGILGVVFGLAIQDWLKDIIRGSSILSDNYFSVGDVVKYNDIEGKVLVIGLKTTKIQDLKTNNIISIANRNIEQIEIVSNLLYINIPMPYEVPVRDAEKVIEDIITEVKKNKNVDDCRYISVNELASSSIMYYIVIECNPINKLQVRRDTLRNILIEMDKNDVSVPYTQVDIHQK